LASSTYSAPSSFGHLDDGVDVVDVEAVDHAVHHHRPAVRLDHVGDAALQLEGLGVREEVVHSRVESWKDSWMWSSPASFSAAMRVSLRPTPEVSRLV
jgi:hypothetical protein